MLQYRYTLPQRKISLKPIPTIEKKLAEKTFGKKIIVSNFTDLITSFPLLIFCNDIRDQKFLGDEINGFSVEFCNKFYPSPTDVGVCFSRNLDTKEVLVLGEDYKPFMGIKDFESDTSLEKSSFWAQSTYVLNAAAFNELASCELTIDNKDLNCHLSHELKVPTRSRNSKAFRFQMQIHQNKTLGHILDDKTLDLNLQTISLQPGHEYVIVLSPSGKESTNGFKQLSLEQRLCRLDNEVPAGSVFKVYSKNNCLYECYISKAFEKCHCIPWDYIHNIKEAMECDIFGRTCFTNTFENLTQFPENICPNCIEECDTVEFNREVIFDERMEQSKNLKNPCAPIYKFCPCSQYLCFG